MLLATSGASLLGNLLTGKGTVRAGEGSEKKALMPPHPLTNFAIRKYYEKELRFNGVYSGDTAPKTIKNGGYVINFDVGTHWTTSYAKIMKLFTLIVLVLSMFLKKSKDLFDIKTSKQTYSEYKHTTQLCVSASALDSLILCWQIKL